MISLPSFARSLKTSDNLSKRAKLILPFSCVSVEVPTLTTILFASLIDVRMGGLLIFAYYTRYKQNTCTFQ